MNSEEIHPNDFSYELPQEQIAQQPLADRSSSKLLHYDNGIVNHKSFFDLPDLIDPNSLIVFNNTKVISARIIFWKETGARIEIFLLEPIAPSAVMDEVMIARQSCSWQCLIGNAKKWKEGSVLHLQSEKINITAHRLANNSVEFTWSSEHSWSEILEHLGKIPLPPYIIRDANELDEQRYQTVYSKLEGAVAAPTAGLHFTPKILEELKQTNKLDYLTLHVSAGTFQPIKTTAKAHPMHKEQIVITKQNLQNLMNHKSVIAVGTTSLRTMESLYWYGVRILSGNIDFFIPKLSPYESFSTLPTKNEALEAVLKHMDKGKDEALIGFTEIFIFPGYTFRVVTGLITNFHMPGTTLMMLVAAFVGKDWKRIYQDALDQKYRLLSYGDSSYLQP